MRLDIRRHYHPLTPALHGAIDRRMRLALGRFDGSVRQVTVRLSEEPGPTGSSEHHCHVDLDIAGQHVVIDERHADLSAAVDRAAERLARAAERALARLRAA